MTMFGTRLSFVLPMARWSAQSMARHFKALSSNGRITPTPVLALGRAQAPIFRIKSLTISRSGSPNERIGNEDRSKHSFLVLRDNPAGKHRWKEKRCVAGHRVD